MDINPVTKRGLILAAAFSFLILAVIVLARQFDRRTTVVFCDVGQGDAAYIRIRNRIDVLVDTGPDKKVLDCLGRYMPFYDRKIEIVIISHEQKDHNGGLPYIRQHYIIGKIFTGPMAGTKITVAGDIFNFYWPIAQPAVLGTTTAADNDQSLVFSFRENNFSVLFTGDIPGETLDNIVRESRSLPSQHINILKIPHHGSKNGLSRKFLELADPEVAVISVGAKNSYGHPAPEVLNALEAIGAKIRRTDREGDIVYKLKVKN